MYRASLAEQAKAQPETPVAAMQAAPVEVKPVAVAVAPRPDHERHAAIAGIHLKSLKAISELMDLADQAGHARSLNEFKITQADIRLAVKDLNAAIAEIEKHLPGT